MPLKRPYRLAIDAVPRLLVALAVLGHAALAGREYLYCTTMHVVVERTCCAHHEDTERSPAPAVSESAAGCCQIRSVPSLGAWTEVARTAELRSSHIAITPLPEPASPVASTFVPRSYSPAMRAGPSGLRALSRLMVFRI